MKITKFYLVFAMLFICANNFLSAQIFSKPAYNTRTTNTVEIAKIEITGSHTAVYMLYSGATACINRQTYLEIDGDKKYLVRAEGLPLCDGDKVYQEASKFVLYFAAINPNTNILDLVEDANNKSGFNFYGIKLTPFATEFSACNQCYGMGYSYKKTNCSTCSGSGKTTQQSTCAGCQGSGSVSRNCGGCGGGGQITATQYQNQWKNVNVKCNACNGVPRVYCGSCQGKGIIRQFYTNGTYQDFRCNNCGGTGVLNCRRCQGSGVLVQQQQQQVPVSVRQRCNTCNGNGSTTNTHAACNGSGYTKSTKNCTACSATGSRKAKNTCQHNELITKKPTIQWDIPYKNSVVSTTQKFSIKACVQSASSVQSTNVYVNDELVTMRGFDVEDNCAKSIQMTVSLRQGQNNIYIEAKNSGGTTISEKRWIEYRPNTPQQSNDNNNNTNNGNSIYYALLIGVNDYDDLAFNDLQNPVQDAEKLSLALNSNYNFPTKNIFILRNPTKENILNKLAQLQQLLREQDNLLIFYAGHGKEVNNVAYWLPKNATTSSRLNWFSSSELLDYIKGFKTKHTLVIADACFSGAYVVRDVTSQKACTELMRTPSRRIMTSGAKTVVPDQSVFMQYLLSKLNNNSASCMSAEQLYLSFKDNVIANSPNNQIPQFGILTGTGDEGGSFIFMRK